jgi:endonuclease/exonuclease/phosphatase family metal-dependent hydrolase
MWQRLLVVAVLPVLAFTGVAAGAGATGAGADAAAAATAHRRSAIAVRIGTFNVLGSQHTAPGGDRSRYPAASVRSRGAARLIAAHRVAVLGTQELQPDQLAALRSRTGMAAWPGRRWGSKETDNSVLYNAHRFKLVNGSRFVIPFMGHPRPQPILRLKDRSSGRQFYVVNTHPSAGGGRYATERRRGQRVLVSVVKRLRATGRPVLVTGDMNDREKFYCHVAPAARLVAANGGSYAHGCRPPQSPIPVDWVLGSKRTGWTRYWRDTRPIERRISDHFLVSATAHIR